MDLIEFTLVLMPLMGFMFLLLDLSWVIYKRATLQFAVREGCRYAVTNQTVTTAGTTYGVSDSIKIQVQARAIGFLGRQLTDLGTAKAGNANIAIRYYCASQSTTCAAEDVDLSNALKNPTDCTDQNNPNGTPSPNQGGNLVEVSVEGYQAFPIMPILRSAAPFVFIVRSSDRMEAKAISGVPPLLTCP